MLKIILVLLIIAMLISLATAMKSLFVGTDVSQSKTYKWLVIRVSIAVAIIIVIIVGFITGDLGIGAPWTGQY